MSARLIEVLTFGHFGPPSARRRLWVEPGRALPVTQWDLLMVYVDRLNGHEQVVFDLHGPGTRYGPRRGALSLTCLELNFDVVARAISRTEHGRVEGIHVELINLALAARAS